MDQATSEPNKPILKVVIGVIRDSTNKLLIAQRSSHQTFAGFWEFPGGKIEVGETPEQAFTSSCEQ